MNVEEYRILFDVEESHWWYENLRALIRRQLEFQDLQGVSEILDIGCGTGRNLQLAEEFGCTTGIDIAKPALEFCKKRGIYRLLQASAVQLPFASSSFDVVLSMDVLYHRRVQPLPALREVHRVLRPGGVVLINVPAYNWLRSSHDEAIHTKVRFTRRQISFLLEKAGLDVARSTYWNTFLFPAAVASRVMHKFVRREGSDLEGYRESVATRLCRSALAVERLVLNRFPLPFGLSIFTVARKNS